MIRTLRIYFLTRLLREKIGLLVLLLIGVGAWAMSFTAKAARFYREQRSTTVTLNEQQTWLDHRQQIETAAQKAASRLDPAQTLDRTRLVAALHQAASEAGLRNTSTNPAPSESNGQFTVHSVDFNAQGAEYVPLEEFYLKLHRRAPYIGIEQFTLTAPNRSDPSKYALVLRVSSVEIPR
jgi:hypothetical protein